MSTIDLNELLPALKDLHTAYENAKRIGDRSLAAHKLNAALREYFWVIGYTQEPEKDTSTQSTDVENVSKKAEEIDKCSRCGMESSMLGNMICAKCDPSFGLKGGGLVASALKRQGLPPSEPSDVELRAISGRRFEDDINKGGGDE